MNGLVDSGLQPSALVLVLSSLCIVLDSVLPNTVKHKEYFALTVSNKGGFFLFNYIYLVSCLLCARTRYVGLGSVPATEAKTTR